MGNCAGRAKPLSRMNSNPVRHISELLCHHVQMDAHLLSGERRQPTLMKQEGNLYMCVPSQQVATACQRSKIVSHPGGEASP